MTATKTADSNICLAAGASNSRRRAGKVRKFPSPEPVLDKVVELAEEMDSVHIEEKSDPEMIIKHPLENAWTLFYKNGRSRSWEDNQKPVMTVTTVEDFWSLYNHIEVASKLPTGADYSLFKEGIFPDWEDPRNQDGGRWIINLDRKHREGLLDTYWLEVLFFLIGEHADQHAFQVK